MRTKNEQIQLSCSDNNITLENFLKGNHISGRLYRRLLKNGYIYINEEAQHKKTVLKKGDRINIILEDEEYDVEPEDLKIDVLYEDRDTLVINKPPFIVVHPTKNILNGTLSNGVASYFKSKNLKRKIRLVNRLDRDTSGIIIYAKNSYAHQFLAAEMERDSIRKRYIAIVVGEINDYSGKINLPISKCENGIGYCVSEQGLPSITLYNTVEKLRGHTLLELELKTGRTHQIRVHMSSIGHPVLGDQLYGESTEHIGRQALHSHEIEFISPETKSIVKLSAPIPEDMEKAKYELQAK
ncbi:MAG: RluA family pseudouridine synthase [Gudongella sp.]|jgi:23S rRNA pseudouridine1911/1915/1917 synthase|nr:RluA family pseudouridine synthase [Gudongella sp.]